MAGLTALQVKNAPPGRHADGHGLYLMVRPGGSRAWMVRVQVGGSRRDFGLGTAEAVPLSEARALAAELRRKAKNGQDVKARRVATKNAIPTFAQAARACHVAMKAGWRNKRHIDSWITGLENHIFSILGDLPVDQIDSILVRDALAPIWMTIPETARRALQRIGTVLDYAHINGWCPTEAALRSVRKGLPRQPRRDIHYDSMPYSQVPALITTLDALPLTAGRDALLFTIHTAVRSNETRFAIWPEFDLDKAVWTIPGDRMKMSKQHVVPLSAGAMRVLERRFLLCSGERGLAFSHTGANPISDMTMTKVLRDLGHAKTTVHGFRSSFTDWVAEETDFPKEVADKALAHQLPDRVEAAYRRTDFFEKRRVLMSLWGDFVGSSHTSLA
jgi:integrase